MKLWKVGISLHKSTTMVIYADSREEALRLVDNSKYDAIEDGMDEGIEIDEIVQLSSKDTIDGWQSHDVVFSYIDELTLGEVRERLEEAEKAAEAEAEFRRRQVEMFPNEYSSVQQSNN
jgi:hypothetical protein